VARHAHYWRIDSTNFGRCIKGRCKETRQFPHTPALAWLNRDEQRQLAKARAEYNAFLKQVISEAS
jgi:hypothetical protein